jgi:DNA-binding NarL/FixJ family response regulator
MRVVIADDSVLVRRGLVGLLTDANIEVLGEAGTAAELHELVLSFAPDVAVIDIRMPPTHSDEGIRAAERIRRERPKTGVLLLSQFVDVDLALRIFEGQHERTGYLLKERVADVSELIDALERIDNGEVVLEPTLVEHLLSQSSLDLLSTLTSREYDVLALMAEGKTDQAISDQLFIGHRTVETHVRAIFRKLDLPSTQQDNRRVHAAIRFLRGQSTAR